MVAGGIIMGKIPQIEYLFIVSLVLSVMRELVELLNVMQMHLFSSRFSN